MRRFFSSKLNVILCILLVIDGMFLFLHLVAGQELVMFNLDHEQNYPTYYQGLKLFLLSGLFLCTYILNRRFALESGKNNTIFWLPLVALFAGLGLDELAQLHETLQWNVEAAFPSFAPSIKSTGFKGVTWLVLYAPIFVAVLAYFFKYLGYLFKTFNKKVATIFISSFVLMFTVPVLEYISTMGVPQAIYPYLVAVEETTEKVAISIMVVFAIYALDRCLSQLNKKRTLT